MVPNIVNVSTIAGKSFYLALANTSATALVSNAASRASLKINMIQVANVEGLARDVTAKYHTQDDIGGTGYALVSTVSVPQDCHRLSWTKTQPCILKKTALSLSRRVRQMILRFLLATKRSASLSHEVYWQRPQHH